MEQRAKIHIDKRKVRVVADFLMRAESLPDGLVPIGKLAQRATGAHGYEYLEALALLLHSAREMRRLELEDKIAPAPAPKARRARSRRGGQQDLFGGAR